VPSDKEWHPVDLVIHALERMTGIEPAFSAWEADVLPLNYIREASQEYTAPGLVPVVPG
jgi:hypothetical protein